jgi:predicted naringenin-chalcone synthase
MPKPVTAAVQAIGTAVPAHEVHGAFIDWASAHVGDDRHRAMFERMAARSGIERRWSVLPYGDECGSPVAAGGFYDCDPLPGTAERMAAYGRYAPQLALAAIADLASRVEIGAITHLVVASCTGFVAPGIDQIIARELGLDAGVERTFIGFMGCYAGITALRTGRHIVRSEPAARVLVVAVELSSLHLTPTDEIERLLAMLQFSDGAAAALLTADAAAPADAMRLGEPASLALAGGEALIEWHIGDAGFVMELSGAVPGRLHDALSDSATRARLIGDAPRALYAIHPGGRSILDAVGRGLDLPADALDDSRTVLATFGNMSSASVLFVLARMIAERRTGAGIALAFGPGVAVEGLAFDLPG